MLPIDDRSAHQTLIASSLSKRKVFGLGGKFSTNNLVLSYGDNELSDLDPELDVKPMKPTK